jgi:hypothetical protein
MKNLLVIAMTLVSISAFADHHTDADKAAHKAASEACKAHHADKAAMEKCMTEHKAAAATTATTTTTTTAPTTKK